MLNALYTMTANKKSSMEVQTVALRFQFDFVDRVRGTTEYRKNNIPAVELANAYSNYVVESEKLVLDKVIKLIAVETPKIKVEEAEVDKNIQLIIDYYEKLEYPRYCLACNLRSKASTQSCQHCGSKELTTIVRIFKTGVFYLQWGSRDLLNSPVSVATAPSQTSRRPNGIGPIV